MKGKKIITGVCLFSLISSMSITTFAAVKALNKNMDLEDIQEFSEKNTYSYKIYKYEKENIKINAESIEEEFEYYKKLVENTRESDSKYAEYKLKFIELEKDHDICKMETKYYDKEKETADKKILDLELKSKYYELCILNNQIYIQRANINYLKKYAEIEAVKLESGQSTEIDHRFALINLEIAKNELSAAKESVQSKTKEISDLINQYKDTENFSVKCNLPQKPDYNKFDAEQLYKNFSDNNLELKKQRRSMKYDKDHLRFIEELYGKENDTYKTYHNAYEINTLNNEIQENNYKTKINELVLSYEQSFNEYNSYIKYNSVLKDKLDILKTAFETGNISELEYLRNYAELSAEMYKADSVLVQIDLIYDKLCMIEEGYDIFI